MNEIFRKFIPNQIILFNNYFLTRFPILWSSRILYLLYFGVIILAFNFLIVGFQQISYASIPDTSYILIYNAVLNFIGLLIWVYYQTILDVKYFHGVKRQLFYLKSSILFFIIILFIILTSITPFIFLNSRIKDTLTDSKIDSLIQSNKIALQELKPYTDVDRVINAEKTNSEEILEKWESIKDITFLETRQNPDYDILGQIEEAYSRLNTIDTFNILISLRGNINFSSYNDFKLFSDDKNPFLQYSGTFHENESNYNDMIDTLKIYYNEVLNEDSVLSKKFNKIIYFRIVRGKLVRSNTDTLIVRYFYKHFNQYGYFNSSFIEDVQDELVETKIKETINASEYNKDDQYAANKIGMLTHNFRNADRACNDITKFLFISFYLSSVLAFIILTIYSIIRFFSIRLFLLGLLLPCLITGFLIALAYFNNFKLFDYSGLILILGCLALFIFNMLRKNTVLNLVIIQLVIYYLWLVVTLFPALIGQIFEIRNDELQMSLILFGAFLLQFIFSMNFVSKIFNIYALPSE